MLLINYASGDFRPLQERNTASALAVGGFAAARSFGPSDIDPQFAKRNRAILCQERGGGYWLWKPYFISRTLEQLADGELLFYCDAGAHFLAPVQPLAEIARRDQQDVIPFELAQPERAWTKRDAFVLLGCDTPPFTNSLQRLASFSLWRRSEFSLWLARRWLELAQDERLLTDLPNKCGLPNYPDFQDHRHDQSLFSLLTKEAGLAAYRNPSQRGNGAIERYPASTYGQLIEHTRLVRASPLRRLVKYAGKRLRKLWRPRVQAA